MLETGEEMEIRPHAEAVMRARSPVVTVLVLAAGLALAACGSAAQPGGNGPSVTTSPSPSPSASVTPTSPPVTTSPSVPPSPSPSPSTAPPTPAVLTTGMSGPAVLQLQQRLAALGYYPGPADGRFGTYTLEAVWAFQAVQGLTQSGTVGPATQAALARPRSPAALVPNGGSTRVEINLASQVLVVYRAGQVVLVSHVSTGGGYYYCSPGGGCGYATTPRGDFRTVSFMPGWITVPLGQMYNSVFFIGSEYAIHGAADVPLRPVSHGCVRIPMDIAEFFHTMIPIPGTPVYVR